MKATLLFVICLLTDLCLRAQISSGRPVSVDVEPVQCLPAMNLNEYAVGIRRQSLIYIGGLEIRPYSSFSLQSVMVKIAGLSAARISFEFGRHTDLLPKHNVMPLTHRISLKQTPSIINWTTFTHTM